jgi:hypothetical protein
MVVPQLQRKVLTIAIIHHPSKPHTDRFDVEDYTYSCLLHELALALERCEPTPSLDSKRA